MLWLPLETYIVAARAEGTESVATAPRRTMKNPRHGRPEGKRFSTGAQPLTTIMRVLTFISRHIDSSLFRSDPSAPRRRPKDDLAERSRSRSRVMRVHI